MKNFIKTGKKEIAQTLIVAALNGTARAVARKRMDLEEAVEEAESNVSKIETITNLDNFDPGSWIDQRLEAKEALALAKAEADNFNKVFPESEYSKEALKNEAEEA